MIHHITTIEWWTKWETNDYFESPDLEKEGFIHCSKREQIEFVLNEHFRDQVDLIILQIDPEKLESELKYELSSENQYFPHIYGRINKTAIVKTENR